MATYTWNGSTGQWTDASQWQGGIVPGAADSAVFPASPNIFTATVASPVAIDQIELDASGSTLDVAANGVLTIGQSILLDAGTLSVEGSITGGALALEGGQLNLDGGTIAGATIQSNFGAQMLIANATLDADTIASGNISVSQSGALTVTNGIVLDGGNGFSLGNSLANVTIAGGLDIEAGSGQISLGGSNNSFEISGGLTIAADASLGISLAGIEDTLDLSGGTVIDVDPQSFTDRTIEITGAGSVLNIDDNETLDHVNIEIGSFSPPPATLAVADGATLVLGPDTTVNQFGSNATLAGLGTIINEGTISGNFDQALTIAPGNFSNAGSISIEEGTIAINPDNFANLSDGTLSGGTFTADFNGILALGGSSEISTLDAALVLDGSGSTLTENGGQAIETSLAAIGAEGSLTLLDNRSFTVTGVIDDAGALSLGGVVFSASSLTIEATGELVGNGTVAASVTNDGTIVAANGVLDVGAVAGTGTLAIASGAELEIGASTEPVSFGGNLGTLRLDVPTGFSGAISDLINGDAIDLIGTTITGSPILVGDNLTVETSTGPLNFTVSDLPDGSHFAAASDGIGGTDLTVVNPNFATFIWTQNTFGGDWSTGANWQYGAAPSFADDAVIAAPAASGSYSINVSSPDTVGNLLVDSAGASLFIGTNFDASQAGSLTVENMLRLNSGSITVEFRGRLFANNITLDGGTLDVEGTVAGATIDVAGGTFSLSGTLSGSVLTADGGSVTLEGGTLDGDMIEGSLSLAQNFSSVEVTNGLTITGAGGVGAGSIEIAGEDARLVIASGTVAAGSAASPATIAITGDNASLEFDGNATLDNTSIQLGSATSTAILLSEDTTGDGAVLTLGSGLQITQTGALAEIESGQSGGIGGGIVAAAATIGASSFAGGVTNQGVITAGFAGGMFTIDGAFTNAGSIIVDNGDTLTITGDIFDPSAAGFINAAGGSLVIGGNGAGKVVVSGDWSNAGSVSIGSGGRLAFDIGITTDDLAGITNNGGTIAIGDGTFGFGELTNTGTLNVGTGTSLGQIALEPFGTITGGTIADAGNGLLFDGGTLNDVSYLGTLTIKSGESLTLENLPSAQAVDIEAGGTLTVTGAYIAADLAGISNNGSLVLAGSLDNTGNTLEVAALGPGSITLGGVITGGTLDDPGNLLQFGVGGAGNSTLDDVSYNGTIKLVSGENLSLQDYQSGTNVEVDAGATLRLVGATQSLPASPGASPPPPSPPTTAVANVDLAGGALELFGAFSTDALAGIVNNNGSLILDAEIVNTGKTLNVGAGTSLGTVTLGGTIVGGTIDDHGGGLVVEFGALDGVTTAGVLTVANGQFVFIEDITNSALVDVATGGSLLLSEGPAGLPITTADLAGITNSGGSITIEDISLASNTVIDNSGAVLALGTGSTLGTVTLGFGGLISGGTIADAGGGLVAQSGTLANVTYQGTLDLTTTSSENVTIASGITLEGPGGSGAGAIALGNFSTLTFADNQTFSGATLNINGSASIDSVDTTGKGAVLTLDSSVAVNVTGSGGITFTNEGLDNGAPTASDQIVNKTTINAAGRFVTVQGNFTNDGTLDVGSAGGSGGLNLFGNLINAGTISLAGSNLSEMRAQFGTAGSFVNLAGGALDLSGGTLEIPSPPSTPYSVTNAGIINIGTGAALDIGDWGNVSNSGTIDVNGGTLYLRDDFTTAALNGITHASGGVSLIGALDNSGATLSVGTGTSLGSVVLGGTISGGTISDITGIIFSGGTLDGVTWAGTLSVSGTVNLKNLVTGDTVSVGNFSSLDLTGNGGSGVPAITNAGFVELFGDFTTASLAGIDDVAAGFETGTVSVEQNATIDNRGGVLSLGSGTALGALDLDPNGTILGGTIADAGGLNLLGGTLDGVTYQGILTLNSGSSLTINDGLTVETATGGLPGVMVIGGTLDVVGTETLDNVSISFGNANDSPSNPAIIADIDNNGAGILTIGAQASIAMGGAFDEIDGGSGAGDGIINQGAIDAAFANGGFSINGASFTDFGTITVGNGTTFRLLSNNFTNLAGGTLTGGTYVVDANSTFELRSGETVSTLDADLTLDGIGSLWKNLAQTTLEENLTGVGSAGTLRLLDNRGYTTSNTLSIAGTVQLGGGGLTAPTLLVASTGLVEGFGAIAGVVTNVGVISAVGGTLDIEGPVAGAGTLAVGAGAELELASGTTQTVSFGNHVGVLKLDDAAGFGGTIAGLIASDVINLVGITLSAAPTLVGNTLTVDTSTGQTLAFQVAGNIAGASFSAASDGVNGTDLVLGAPSGSNPNPAVAEIVSPTALTLPNAHLNRPDSVPVTIENAATASGAGTLDAGIGPVTGNGIFALGSITGLAPGSSDGTDIFVGTDTTTAGKHSGTVILDFASGGVTLPSQDISVTGAVYRLGAAVLNGPATTPIVHVGDNASETINVSNFATNDGYSEDVTATAGLATGGFVAKGSTGDIAPGSSSGAITVAIPTTTDGAVSSIVAVNLKSDGTPVDGLGQTSLGTQSIEVNATVNNYANPVFENVAKVGTDSSRLTPVPGSPNTYALNFGIFDPDSPKSTIDLDLRNLAGLNADLLNGNFSVSGTVYETEDPGSPLTTGTLDNGDVFDQTGFDAFTGLKSPSASLPLEITFDPKGDVGDNALFSETITLKPTGSNASGYNSNAHLSPITLVISGGVEANSAAEIELAPDPVMLGNAGVLHLQRPGTLVGGPPAQTLTYPIDVTNGADDPDKDPDLVAFPGTADAPATSLTGSPTSPLAPQDTAPGAFNLNFPQPNPNQSQFEAGPVDGTFTVGGASLLKKDLFHPSPYTSPLPYEEDTFQGTVYDFSKPMVYATTSNGQSAFFCIDGTVGQNQLDLGTIDSPVTITFYASNDAPNSPYSDSFTPTLTDQGGDTNFTFQASPSGAIKAGTQGVVIGTMTVSKPSSPSSTHALQLTDMNNSVVAGFTGQLVDPAITFTADSSSPPPPPPPPPPSPHGGSGGGGGGGGSGGAWGDVHIITYSGLHYDFQAAGEFVLTKATDPTDPFQVQIRLQPWENNNSVSVTTQLATEVGSDRVTFDIDRAAAGTGFVWENGAAVTVDAAHPTLQLSGGTLNYIGPGNYVIDYDKGETLQVLQGGDYLNYTIGLPTADGPGKNAVTGLDGVNAVNPADDLVLGPAGTGAAAGTILAQPIAASELYTQYANSWRVSPTASTSPNPSLFDYGAGQNTGTFTDKNFPANPLSIGQLPTAVIAQAKALAAAAGITDPTLLQDAILDYIQTGSINFITGNANLQATGNVTPNATDANITFSPPPLTVSVNALNTKVTEAQSGTTAVEFSVTRTGSTASPLAVDYTVTTPGAGYLGTGAFGGTLPSGTATIAAGDTLGLFTVNVPQNALGTDPSDLLQVTLTPPTSATATVPVAQSEIVNDQPEPGANPPQLALELTSGNATLTQNGNAWTLNFGTLASGATPSAEIAAVNAAAGPADNLSGAVSLDAGSTGAGFANNLGGFDALKPLQIGNAAIVSIAAGATGSITETLDVMSLAVNDSGYSNALTPVTLNITATLPSTQTVDPPTLTGASGPLVNGSTVTVTGTGDVGDTVTLFADGGIQSVGSGAVGMDGSFSIQTSTTFADGKHTVTATETNGGGITSTLSNGLLVLVDPNAPALTGTTGPLVNGNAITVTGTGEVGETVALFADGGTIAIGSTTIGTDGTFSVTTGTGLVDGEHTVTATVTDAAGLTSAASSSLPVAVDPNAPALTGTTGLLVNGNAVTVTGTGEVGETVALFADGGAQSIGSGLVGKDGSFSIQTTAAFADGKHAVTATQTDADGLTGAVSGSLFVLVDPNAPVLTGTTGPLVNGNAITVTGTGEAGETVALFADGGTTVVGSTTIGTDGTFSVTTGTGLVDGEHTVTATVTDTAGLTSAASPSLPVAINPSAPVLTGTTGALVNGDAVTVTGTGEAGETVTLFADGGTTAVGSGLVGKDGSFSIQTSTAFADGKHSVTATETDADSLTSALSNALPVSVNPNAPVLTGTTGALVNGSTVTVTGTGEAGEAVSLFADGGTTAVGSGKVGNDGSFSIQTNAAFADGKHSVTATQTDADGLTGAVSSSLIVPVDPNAPVLTGTSGPLVNGNAITVTGTGEVGETVALFADGGTGSVGSTIVGSDGTFSITTSSAFADGKHTVTATMTDADDLTSAVSAGLPVAVDPNAPVLIGTSGPVVNGAAITVTGTGEIGETVTLFADGGTGSVGSGTVGGDGSFSITTSAAFAGGNHTVTATETDADGLTSAVSNDLSVAVPCFCRGTQIMTDRGEIAVEDLAVGDRVLTLSGAAKPIVWIGMGRDLVTRRNSLARPVIVRRDALADGVPCRDLYLTHGHALYLDGVLIPVEQLVNHASIAWDEAARVVEYYHIELADHDVLIADGVPAESYYDAANRAAFQNTRPGSVAGTIRPTFAPVLHGGEVVQAVWARLCARAGQHYTGETTNDPDLHLMSSGRRLNATGCADGVYTFTLKAPPTIGLRLVSRCTVPSLLGLDRREHRRLGVAICQIILSASGSMTALDHDAPLLVEGGCHRPDCGIVWTDGALDLPASLFAHLHGACTIVVQTRVHDLRYPTAEPAASTSANLVAVTAA